MSTYVVTYITFNESGIQSYGICPRITMLMTHKMNMTLRYGQRVVLRKINAEWAEMNITYNNRLVKAYFPLIIDGKPTCVTETEFYSLEFLRFEQQFKSEQEIKRLNSELKCAKMKIDELEMRIQELSVKKTTKKASIPKKIRELCWNIHIGEDKMEGSCLCCNKTTIKFTTFHCGHIIAEANGGSTNINNLKPICAGCNLSMGQMNMDTFIETYLVKNV